MSGFTTYGISDPRSGLFVYVGQTGNFERRKKQHLAAHRLRKPPRGSIKAWLKAMYHQDIEPVFTILEVVETEEESLVSETKWVEKIAALGHGLFNRWDEHRDILESAERSVDRKLEPLIFSKGQTELVGRVESNTAKTGYRVHIDEAIELIGPVTIDLLPAKSV